MLGESMPLIPMSLKDQLYNQPIFEQRLSFQQMVPEKVDIHMQNNESKHRQNEKIQKSTQSGSRPKCNIDDLGYNNNFLDTYQRHGS